jgi:hypothetical protein
MSDIGPKQGNLFGVRAKPPDAKPHDAKPQASEAAASGGTQGLSLGPPPPDTRAPRPLWIGPAQQAAIADLVAKAGRERVPLEDVKRRVQQLQRGIPLPQRYNKPFTIDIPFGFTATYTIEEQPQGWTRRLSVAADRSGRAPHPAAVDMLMREFGFRAAGVRQIEIMWMEPLGNDRQAVNLVEYIEANAGAVLEDDYIRDPDLEPPEE